ncbi:MAG: NfeD family protein [Planctomycetaceae bacterium]|jgi:membrane-bound ClpP family serine protease|nr:NfeD family protein [Planctomycetaceae bacterium]
MVNYYWFWTFVCLGIGLFLGFIEVFIPSGGVLAFLTLVAIIGSIIFAFLQDTFFGAIYMFSIVLLLPCLVWGAVTIWPHTIIGRRVLLNPEEDPALRPNTELLVLKQLIGKHGVARSKMIFSGQIEIDGHKYNAMSDIEAIEPNTPIVVVGLDCMTLLVRRSEGLQTKQKITNIEVNNDKPTSDNIPETIYDPFA